MKFVYIFIFLISCAAAQAQVRLKLNYNHAWELTTPDSAAYIRVCIYDTTNVFFAGPLSDLYLTGKPQMTGKYVSKKKEGEFVFYYENGQVESRGMFADNLRAGVWTYYYADGKVKQEIEFSATEDPKVITFNDLEGKLLVKDGNGDWKEEIVFDDGQKIIITGQYKNYKKDGKWKTTNKDMGEIERKYDNGVLKSSYLFHGTSKLGLSEPPPPDFPLPQKFVATENFSASESITLDTYPILNLRLRAGGDSSPAGKSGKVYVVVERQPEFIGGLAAMSKFLSKNLHYPPEARKKHIKGTVYVEFVVQQDGRLGDFKVLQGIGGGCDEEAVKFLTLMNDPILWRPAMQNGVPVRVRFVLPINFSGD